MKKILYFVLAAALIVASCAKEPVINDEKTPVNPSGETTALFSASIIQPNGLDGATKVSIVDDPATDKVFINWNSGDKIWVLPSGSDSWSNAAALQAVSASANTDFTGDIPEQSDYYTARYFGPDDVWKEYVLNGFEVITVTDAVNPAALQNMPLYCAQSSRNGGRNYLNFSCEYAILQVNVPSKLEYDNLYVCVDDQEVEFENGIKDGSTYTLCVKDAGKIQPETGKAYAKIFVPVAADQYDKITLVASKGEDTQEKQVAWMQTYCAENNTVSVAENTIYFFDFCNTKTINEAGTYSLESNNGIDYKVNIAADIQTDVTINAEVEGKEPANIYINNRGHQIDGILTINASKSHVEGENGFASEVIAKTSNSTFVVKPTLTITGLTVKKGSVVVEGTEENKANVDKVTIPSDVEGSVSIDVTGVSAEGNDRVEIVNNSDPENVSVVIEKNDKTAGGESKEYYVTQNEVTPVEKDIVATIGKTGYETLAAAVEAVKTGETIILIKDVELESVISTGAKTFTLTLNANITPKTGWNGGQTLVDVNRGGSLTINGTGKISNNGIPGAYAAVRMTGKNESGDGAVAKLTVDGSVTLEGYYYGIVGNGTRHNTEITVKGGIIKGTYPDDNIGIFHPQSGTLTINGGTIEGSTGIVLKGGKLVVNDGEIIGNGQKGDFEHNGSGWNQTGDALAVEVCDYPGQPLTVEIKGGKFSSPNAEAVASYAQNDSYTPLKGFIYGGTFSSDPWKYCAKGYASIEQGGKWVIVNAPKADVVKVHPDPDMTQKLPDPIKTTLKDHLFYKSESQTSAGIPIPSVKDGRMLLADGYNNVVDVTNGLSSITSIGNLNGLDVCYIFAAKCGQGEDSDGTDGEFDDWNADFVVSLDKDVNKDEIGLWGYYSIFGALAFKTPEYIPAGTEIELLGWATNGGQSKWKYSEIKSIVNVFPCGAFKLSDNIKDATIKVDLRIFDPDDHSKYFVIESYEYKFTNETNAVISKEVNSQDELNAAIANANAGDGISIATTGEYKLPASLPNITISGVDGVEFDCTGSGSIASIPNGATFKNVEMNFGAGNYHGFQHAGHITMEGCTLNGLFFSYGDMTFTNCIFNQTTTDYNMWVYAGDVTYSGCTFNSKGKFLNVYNEGNNNGASEYKIPWKVIAENCVFNCTADNPNKAPLNIKESCGNTALYYDVIITNCTCNAKQNGLANADDGTLYRVSPIWQVDDRKSGMQGIKVTVNNKVVYEAGSPVTE